MGNENFNNSFSDVNEIDVKIKDFCEELELEVLTAGRKKKMHISTYHVNRPGLQLAGFFEHFSPERVQVIGEQEMSYLRLMDEETRRITCENLCKFDFPCLVVTTVLEPLKELMEAAKKYDRIMLRSNMRTTFFVNRLSLYLNELLAPNLTIHGVLVDLFGVGVLIVGKSSVGKSETALELIQRGHRLVADDAVEIKLIGNRLVGTSPSTIRHFMELRGIGIIDIKSMYGSGAIMLKKDIDLVIKLEEWNDAVKYDRLGGENNLFTILGEKRPMNTVPVKPGRNIAVILEVAARNFRLKTMGYNAIDELYKRMSEQNNK